MVRFFFVQGQDDKESKSQESAGQFQSLGAGRAELGKAREFEKLKDLPYPVAPPGVKCSYPKYDPVALLG